jgi:hypothetical protein
MVLVRFLALTFRWQACCETDRNVRATALETAATPAVFPPGSSNGRTQRSERCNAGSNPAPGSNHCCGDRNGYGLACKASTCGFESRPQLHFALVAQLEERRISTPGLRGFESCRELHTCGELAERQGTAMLMRRDLRVGQVRLLHSPPLFSLHGAGVAQRQSRWFPPRRCGFDSRCPLHSLTSKT